MWRLLSRNPHGPSAAGKEVLIRCQQFYMSPNNRREQIHTCCCTLMNFPPSHLSCGSFLLLSVNLFSTEPSTHTVKLSPATNKGHTSGGLVTFTFLEFLAKVHLTAGEECNKVQLWGTLHEYFHFMLLYTSTPLHFRGRYFTFYSTTFTSQL